MKFRPVLPAALAAAAMTFGGAGQALAGPPSWDGTYVGAYAALGFANLQADVGLGQGGIGGFGPAAGGIVGYNRRLDQRIVGGVELSGGWADFHSRQTFTIPGDVYFDGTADSNWNASVMGRFGFLLSPTTMLFMSAGGTIGGGEYSVYADDTNGGILADVSRRPGLYGFAYVGAGIETQLMADWRLRYEYVYNYLKAIDIEEAGVAVLPQGGVGKVALIYAFERPGAEPSFGYAPRSWTDVYLGAVAGHGMALSKFEGPGYDLNGISSTGFLYGLIAGAQMQLGPSWVAGIEAEYSSTDVSLDGLGADRFAALRGRLGYLTSPGTMVYGTAGLARLHLNTGQLEGFPGLGDAPDSHYAKAVEIGGGIETFLLPNLSIRAEYLYTIMEKDALGFAIGEKTTGGAARLALTGHFGG